MTSSDIPTKTSDLTNDSGFINISSVPTLTSQLTNDSGYITDIPIASSSTIGGVIVGDNITIDLNGRISANAEIDVDNELSALSKNPLQNKIITSALAAKQDMLTAGTDISITTGSGGSDTISGNGSVTLTDAEADGLNSVTLTGGCEQTYLPEGYTRTITTINDATAASKIDTGLMPMDGDVIELKIHIGRTGVSFYAFQSRISGGASIFGISGSSSGSTISADWGSTLNSNIARTADHDLIIRVSFVNGVKTIYVKDLTDNTEDTQTGTYNATSYVPVANYYLWGNTVNYLNREYPVYEVKLTNNGVTRLHYIPCTRNSDSVAGFYDLTTNTFITTATNVLTAGAVAPSPTNPLGIICNNGTIKAENKSGLPLGYQRVEYLQSTGTQYIDTGFNIPDLTDSYRVELKMTVDGGTGNAATSNNLGYMGQNSGLMLTYTRDYGLGIGSAGIPVTSGYIFEVVQKRNADCTRELIVDNTTFTITTQATLYADRNYGIFRLSPFDQTYNAIYGKIYEFKGYKNNVLTYNLVPCRRKSDNVLGMYDTVNKTFLTNAGTGTFSAGNDVDDFEITTDGMIETVTDESSNTATAEILCGIGNYTDTQELLSGTVTRNLGIKILDGTESGTWITLTSGVCTKLLSDVGMTDAVTPLTNTNIYSTHFIGSSYTPARSIDNGIFVTSTGYFGFSTGAIGSTDEAIDTWLAAQYANGTPVIVVYPLATATTETVTGQTLTTVQGDNTLTISQASIDNLQISANYNLQGGTIISFSGTIPTKTSDLTNDSGFITSINSSDVTTALGYTPVNPSNLATVATSGLYSDLAGTPTIPTVGNGTITITQGGTTKGTFTVNQSGDTTIALDAGGGSITVDQTFDDTSSNAQSGIAIAGELSNYVTTSDLSDYVMFTDLSSTLVDYVTSNDLSTTLEDYLLESNFSSTLDGYVDQAFDSSSSNPQSGVAIGIELANYVQSSSLSTVATTGDYDDLINKPTIPSAITVDQTYDSTSTNAQSGVAIAGELADYQESLVSGTNIKTINSTSLLGSGNINLPSMDNTTFRMYTGAKYYWYNNNTTLLWYAYTASDTPSVGDLVSAYDYGSPTIYRGTVSSVSSNSITISSNVTVINGMTFYRYSTLDEAGYYKLVDDEDTELEIKSSYLADTTLSNVSSIDSSSAVKTALDSKVSKSGDTMSGRLQVNYASASDDSPIIVKSTNLDFDTVEVTNIYSPLLEFVDMNNNRMGQIEYVKRTDGRHYINICDKKDSATASYSSFSVGWNNNNAYCTFPNTTCCDGQWTSVGLDIKVNYTLAAGATENWSISGLPSDSYTYEVMGSINASSSGTTAVGIRSAVVNSSVCRAVTIAGQSSTFTIPIGTDHKIGLANINTSASVTINYFRIFAYRRIGTNS